MNGEEALGHSKVFLLGGIAQCGQVTCERALVRTDGPVERNFDSQGDKKSHCELDRASGVSADEALRHSFCFLGGSAAR